MSAQSTPLCEKIINALRLITLIEKATVVLRRKFHEYFPTDPANLYNEISKHKKTLQSKMLSKIICRNQYNILLPSSRKTDSSKFDITLLTFALRVLCHVEPPITGWNSLPCSSDQTDGANLVRIRIGRNDLLHSDLKYECKYYTNVWDGIALALESLGCSKQELDDLKNASLDPELETNYLQKLHELVLALQRVADLEDSLEGVSYNVFPSTTSFVGREKELSEIHQALSEREENQLAMVTYGLGGVGKSELARQYCQQYGTTSYKRNVIWINGEDKNSMTEDFINVAERIKLKTLDKSNKPLSIKTIVSKVYRFFAGRPVLFVFDNIINKSDLMDFIETNTPSKVSILITSQFSEWSERFIPMRIEVLLKETALVLVRKHVGKYNLNDENANSLCETMQCLPLALHQAIAYIKAWSITVDEYLIQFESHAEQLMVNCHGDERYGKTILTTWNMAYDKIIEEENSSLAIIIINVVSYLDGSCIKEELFYEYYDKYLVQKSLKLLQKYSLITVKASDADLQQIIQVHSLLQYVIRVKSDQDYLQQFLDMIFNIPKEEVVCGHADYGEHFWHHLVFMFGKKEWRKVITLKCADNIDYIQKIFISKGKIILLYDILIAIEILHIETIGCHHPDTIKTQNSIGHCLQMKGDYDEALVKYRAVEQLRIEILGYKNPDTLTTQNNIAHCLQDKGNYDEALVKYREVEKLRIEILGSKDAYTLRTQTNIAVCLFQKGYYDKALVKHIEVEQLKIESLGYKHQSTLITQNNIASCLQKKGSYDKALETYIKVEKLRKEVLGNKHPSTLTAQHNIASCLQYKGDFDEALVRYREVEKLRKEIIGYKHADTLTTQNNIASCLQYKGNCDEALVKYREVEQLQINCFGCQHPNTIATQNNIAGCLKNKGNYDEALTRYMEVKKLRIEILGYKHPSTLKTIHNIASCLQKKGNYDKALETYMEVEQLRIELLGHKDLDTLKTKNSIASCLHDMGNHDNVLAKYMEVKQLRLEILGYKHPDTLATLHDIANCLHSEGNHDEALDIYMEVHQSQIEILGYKHPDTLKTKNSIASCLHDMGNNDNVLAKYMEVKQLRIEILGYKHPDTLATLHDIANCLQSEGNHDEALDIYMEVHQLQIEILGYKHPDTLKTKNSIASCLCDMGNHDDVLAKYIEVKQLRIEILGYKHPDTLKTQHSIACCLQEMGNYDEALVKYKEVEELRREILDYKHPSTLRTRRDIAFCLKYKGKWYKLLPCYIIILVFTVISILVVIVVCKTT